MSHRLGTFCGVSDDPAVGPARWRLERAGIVNVYQYGNEVLDFSGGRLLLRGVNGSGKSTAMNMLLPFLLTANQRNIDAAQEQHRLLHSWMLTGRDDPQPIGYLWIEFRRAAEFFACGCGIRANRQSERVTTWWFATSKRPGIDFELVEAKVPLTAEQLRAQLGDDPVFRDPDRAAYRQLVERRLFSGARLDQHIRLIDKVRNPRVGDRIDRDLPHDLADALPQLSDRALNDAAAPLDDLDEHRRNMAELERTVSALGALLERYRSYCAGDLRARADAARQLLAQARRWRRDEAKLRSEADAAEQELSRITQHIGDEERRVEVLRSRIAAIVESSAYQEGRQLDDVRNLVDRLRRAVADAESAVASITERIDGLGRQASAAQRRSEHDLERMNGVLSVATQLAGRCGLGTRPGSALSLQHALIDGTDAARPEAVDAAESARRLDATSAAIQQRRLDISAVDAAHGRFNDAETQRGRLEDARNAALESLRQAVERCESVGRLVAAAQREWQASVRRWVEEATPMCTAAGTAPTMPDRGMATTPPSDVRARLRGDLLAAVGAAIDRQHDAAAAAEHHRDEALAAVAEQQSTVDELMSRSAPTPPRLEWQTPDGYCLADVVDFAADLRPGERAGLEAALEASGLLEARPVGPDVIELATGELVAVGSQRADQPLSLLLEVAVPGHLADRVNTDVVARLLDSVECEPVGLAELAADEASAHPSGTGVAFVSTDGAFGIGSLRGRHAKQEAEHIGAAARREALERHREAARQELERRRAEATRMEALLVEHRQLLDRLQAHRDAFPPSSAVDRAEWAEESAGDERERADERRQAAESDLAEAERAVVDADAELHRVAAQHSLPRGRDARRDIVESLAELDRHLESGKARLETLERQVNEWGRVAQQLCDAVEESALAREDLMRAASEMDREQARLDTLVTSVGVEYQRLRGERDRLDAERHAVDEALPAQRRERDAVRETRAHKHAEAGMAARSVSAAEDECDAYRRDLESALAAPGYLAALGNGETLEAPASAQAGSRGLRDVLAGVDHIVARHGAAVPRAADPGADLSESEAAAFSSSHGDDAPARSGPEVSAENVRQSLRQRRDALGAGWDAVDAQPDPQRPLRIDVSGPHAAHATLPDAHASAASQLATTAGLLDRQQQDALQELLQGLIAREIYQKLHDASDRIALMNRRLGKIETAHRVGVRLRWRRSRDLDPATARMVDLLAKPPDLRTASETDEVRAALAARLAEARADEPDAPYRQLIARTLDYKSWHDLDVMIRRPEAFEARLSRRTRLSEGEKKLVTYLLLFAAVAASYDAMVAAQAPPHGEPPGIERFVLLDDAFAKVSADNHEALFGLLVELDLDFIATSERLWGDHATVPELSIVEIVRDPSLRTILLDRYRWQGHAMERSGAA